MNTILKIAVFILVQSFMCVDVSLAAELSAPKEADKSALNSAIQTMCNKSIVAIGENAHGDGHSLIIKAGLVEALVEKCGFNTVLFESSTYEFIPIARKQRTAETISQELIENAVGGVWKFEKEMQPLLQFMTEKVNAGQLEIGGLDYQVGGLGQPFSNDTLALELTEGLPADRRVLCRDLFKNWVYNTALPKQIESEEMAQSERLNCISQMENTLKNISEPDQQTKKERIDMFENFVALMKADNASQQVRLVTRARMMIENSFTFINRKGKNIKVIIWCHNAHAAKSTELFADYNGADNLGTALKNRFGETFFSLSITAQKGVYRWSKGIEKPLPSAPKNALENLAIKGENNESYFIGTDTLLELGPRPAAMFYHNYQVADWNNLFDGILVLNEEFSPHSTRPGW
ncbi:erythromycin esterase family protein [Shewanella cyperi]|uniref:erythromycin esterase family protein n=1 Tax=Shewanella cyperi TaxID=2814292 RepID=UPI001A946AE3|nr:erythromycin esterase family protein [Shewanella cyperi]QSX40024.1 erythromycin esterase family protein [Shewanella cyperi]